MERLRCSDSFAIPQPSLQPKEYLGAGAHGFVLKVSDASSKYSALKIVPVIVKSNEEKAGGIMRERQFYQYLENAKKMRNLARATTWWSIENMEMSTYLKWNKDLRKQLNAKVVDYPSQQIKIASQLLNSHESGKLMLCVHFVQMEYYASGNLTTWLKDNFDKFKEKYALRIQLFCDILNAVDFLHKRGLMHRDICPNNIFLSEDNDRVHAILGDFDTIVSCGEQALWPLTKVRSNITRVLGTAPYAAPEIDGGNYNEQCDLYSLGVIVLNLFLNIVDRIALEEAIYKISQKEALSTCICAEESTLWLEILKAQLSGTPEDRMSCYKLLEVVKTREESLCFLESETKTELKPKAQQSNIAECCLSSRELFELDATAKGTRKQTVYLLHYSGKLIKLENVLSKWVMLAKIPKQIRNFSAAASQGKLYVVGGQQFGILKNSKKVTNVVQEYDTQTSWQGWHNLPNMQERRRDCGAAALDGRLFAVGGMNEKCSPLKSVEQCDLGTGRWTHVASMTAARRGLGVAILGDLLFAVGGWGDSYLNLAEYYDPRIGRWTVTTPMRDPRDNVGCAALGNRLFVAGCWTGVKQTASVEWFDFRAGKWECMKDMSAPRSEFALAALNGQLLAAGGKTSSDKYLNTVEMYDKNRDTWITLDVRLPYQDKCVGCVLDS